LTRFPGIDLTEGVKRRHLLAYFAAALISSSHAGALAMLQPGLLQVMEIDPARQATLTGNLSAMQEVILIALFGAMVGALAMCHISDRVTRVLPVIAASQGRKPVNRRAFITPHAPATWPHS
jgi:hypothetical protein